MTFENYSKEIESNGYKFIWDFKGIKEDGTLEDDFNLIIYCYEQSNPTNRIFHKKLNLEETKDFFSNIFKFKNIETGFNLKLDEIKK
jgi:hypothetical protein